MLGKRAVPAPDFSGCVMGNTHNSHLLMLAALALSRLRRKVSGSRKDPGLEPHNLSGYMVRPLEMPVLLFSVHPLLD